jgi:hypothetical protein
MSEQTVRQPQLSPVRRRPWYTWPVGLAWVALLVFLVQNAIASGTELEPRAAMIFWVSAGVVLLIGLVLGAMRGKR